MNRHDRIHRDVEGFANIVDIWLTLLANIGLHYPYSAWGGGGQIAPPRPKKFSFSNGFRFVSAI